jgi:hypothetical protein
MRLSFRLSRLSQGKQFRAYLKPRIVLRSLRATGHQRCRACASSALVGDQQSNTSLTQPACGSARLDAAEKITNRPTDGSKEVGSSSKMRRAIAQKSDLSAALYGTLASSILGATTGYALLRLRRFNLAARIKCRRRRQRSPPT